MKLYYVLDLNFIKSTLFKQEAVPDISKRTKIGKRVQNTEIWG